MTSRWQKEREAIVAAGREIAAKGLVAGSAGNVSMRLGDAELLAITPRGKRYDAFSAADVQVIDFAAEPVEGDQVPSVESLMHIAAYRARPDARAVVHTHSIYASVLAVAHLSLPPLIDEMVTSLGGEICVAEYAFPSSEELAEHAAKGLVGRNAVLLANHGVVGIGKDLRDAIGVCELVERAAQVYVFAKAIGRVNLLPPDVVESEQELFKMLHFKPPGESVG